MTAPQPAPASPRLNAPDGRQTPRSALTTPRTAYARGTHAMSLHSALDTRAGLSLASPQHEPRAASIRSRPRAGCMVQLAGTAPGPSSNASAIAARAIRAAGFTAYLPLHLQPLPHAGTPSSSHSSRGMSSCDSMPTAILGARSPVATRRLRSHPTRRRQTHSIPRSRHPRTPGPNLDARHRR